VLEEKKRGYPMNIKWASAHFRCCVYKERGSCGEDNLVWGKGPEERKRFPQFILPSECEGCQIKRFK
jgi:hypothetical protein